MSSKYSAFQITRAYIQTSDGREIELKLPNTIAPVEMESTPDTTSHSIDCTSWFPESVTFVGYIRRIRVGPFWMPLPPDRTN